MVDPRLSQNLSYRCYLFARPRTKGYLVEGSKSSLSLEPSILHSDSVLMENSPSHSFRLFTDFRFRIDIIPKDSF